MREPFDARIRQRHALVDTWLPGCTWPIGYTLMAQAHADRGALLDDVQELRDANRWVTLRCDGKDVVIAHLQAELERLRARRDA